MAQSDIAMPLPSFSIIVETENLSTADLAGLAECLDSLKHQSIAPATADNVWLINSGNVPEELLQDVRTVYPWVTIHHVEAALNYYDSKMYGVSLASGDIIIFADSDCCYSPNWLESMLTSFAQDASIQVVAGETAMAITGPYSLAMAMTYIFPPFGRKQSLHAAAGYYCNNVAFRREFLQHCPIPSKLPIYRGNCSTHAATIKKLGHTIWKQPQARATHAPPENLAHFFWRFLLMGSDDWLMGRKAQKVNQFDESLTAGQLLLNRFLKALRRGRTVLREQPARLLYLPVALPIALASLGLMCIGFAIAAISPYFLLSSFEKLENRQGNAGPKLTATSAITE